MTRSAVLRGCSVALIALVAIGLAGGAVVNAGRSAADEPSGALAVVVGARSNMPRPSLDGAAASARDLAVAQQSYLSVVVADGAPYTLGRPGPLTADAALEADRDEQREANRRRVDDAVAAARARTPETDLLTALTLAGASIVDRPGLRTLVVVDSGLSTTGPMDFGRPGMFDADPREVADTLADFGQLPDLDGFSVVFQGLGDTAPPQQPLDAARRTQLVELWTTVVERAGAAVVDIEVSPLAGTPEPGLPPVRPVAVDPGFTCTPTRLTLSGGGLGFRPGGAVLRDPSRVADVLRPYAEQMISRGTLVAEVFGRYSEGEPAAVTELTELRAQEVANVLIAHGVPIPQLRVKGFGSDFPEYVPDRDATGHLIPATAALNRTVIIEFTEPVTCI
ncbi:hypothetical protein [Blastococcus mobilis]|uniref:OmpA family protein n=1 Tax=Blastococcus mobilis TaxID=1938746 RepID=A0A238Z108_9ACTN|nr:hypothetical protein [Blastococcus mobilis]SNR76952.1 hypothetical protein SAMN06272737_12417 [Blastococcus mobilis]